MPAHLSYRFLPKPELLTFEEITSVAQVFVDLGVRKIRLTGGEPLLRQELERLVGQLAKLQGNLDLALTTNGYLLAGKAQILKDAGLHRITVSLDSLDPVLFAEMSGRGAKLESVLAGIDAALAAGLGVKLNMVVQRGVNEQDIVPMVRFAKEHGLIVRFIEYMDVGNLNDWDRGKVVTSAEILKRIAAAMPFEPIAANYPGEVANRYRFADSDGEFGIIASVTQPFCGGCSRARLSASGSLYTCLFAQKGTDLKTPLRSGDGIAGVRQLVGKLWRQRDDRYSQERQEQQKTSQDKVEMYHIGG